MMTFTTGYFYNVAETYKPFRYTLTATLNSQNIANNSSNVTFVLKLDVKSGNAWSGDSITDTLTVNGTSIGSGSRSSGGSTSSAKTYTIYTLTKDFTHNSDGTLTLNITNTQTGANINYAPKNISLSGTYELPTIARGLSISSFDSQYLGQSVTATLNNPLECTSATITWADSTGNITGSLTVDNDLETATGIISRTVMNYLTTVKNAQIDFSCTSIKDSETYTVNQTFTFSINPNDTDFQPDANITTPSWSSSTNGIYAKGYSNALGNITINSTSCKYGATLSNVSVSCGSFILNTTSTTSVTIAHSYLSVGTNTITVTVTDSRGVNKTYTYTFTVYDYTAPTWAGNLERDNVTSIVASGTITWSSISTNTISWELKYNDTAVLTGNTASTTGTASGTYSGTSSHTFTMRVYDSISSNSYQIVVPTAEYIVCEEQYRLGLFQLPTSTASSGNEQIDINATVNVKDFGVTSGTATITKTSGNSTVTYSNYYKIGNIVFLSLYFHTSSSTAAGSNIFLGTIENDLIPVDWVTCGTYNTSDSLAMTLSDDGTLTVRNCSGGSVAADRNIHFGFTYIV